jgi:hypothetical protein
METLARRVQRGESKNQWAVHSAAHDLALKKPSSFVLVPGVGLGYK